MDISTFYCTRVDISTFYCTRMDISTFLYGTDIEILLYWYRYLHYTVLVQISRFH